MSIVPKLHARSEDLLQIFCSRFNDKVICKTNLLHEENKQCHVICWLRVGPYSEELWPTSRQIRYISAFRTWVITNIFISSLHYKNAASGDINYSHESRPQTDQTGESRCGHVFFLRTTKGWFAFIKETKCSRKKTKVIT